MKIFLCLCVFIFPKFCLMQNTDGQLDDEFVYPKDRTEIPTGRVVGGVEVTPHAYPFQVGLFIYSADGGVFCGGTLISPQWVLTAAHCLANNPRYVLVHLGAHNVMANETSQLILNSTTFFAHQKWNDASKLNDIALVKLPRNVTSSQNINTVRLASGNQTYVRETGTIIGWGVTNVNNTNMPSGLRKVSGPIISNDECAAVDVSYLRIIAPSHLCLNGGGTIGSCSGDSGGPLIVNGEQVGIVSFGYKDCVGNPSVFTRVTSFNEWIVQHVGGNSSYKSVNCSVAMFLIFLLVRLADWI